MKTQRDRDRNSGPRTLLLSFLLLAASSLTALSQEGGARLRRDASRQRELQAMSTFAIRYGNTDFSIVGEALAAWPNNPSNPQAMSVLLSLAHASLNQFEQSHDPVSLERSLALFEAVARSRELWGIRPFAGSVVAYLGVGAVRLEAGCGIDQYRSRIDELLRNVAAIAAEEADAVATVEEETEEFVETTAEEDAARAALYAAAVNLRTDDPRATRWGGYARGLAVSLSNSDSQSAETVLSLALAALLYEMSGVRIPPELEAFALVPARVVFFRSTPESGSLQVSDPVAVVEPGDSLALAIDESRAFAAALTSYLGLSARSCGNPLPARSFRQRREAS